MTEPSPKIVPSMLPALSPDDAFRGGDVGTVLDFWRWALGDLRMNTARGYLAEWLVASAVGDTRGPRVEWDAWDVVAPPPHNTRIEVKTTGRLQSWTSRKLSTPRWPFPGLHSTRYWDEARGEYVEVAKEDRVDVWVFALHTATSHDDYDPLNVSQWEFRVVPHRVLLGAGQTSGGLALFERLGVVPTRFAELRAAVHAADAAPEAGFSRPSPST